MAQSLAPYLDVLRTQLETALVPRDENARKVPLYTHRLLTVLLARQRVMPELQRKALGELAAVLDALCGELGRIEGGMILAPQLMKHIRASPDYAAAESCLQTAVRLLAQHPSAAGRQLQRRIATILADMENAFHQAVTDKDMKPAAQEAARSLDVQQVQALRDYLRRQFPTDAALEIGPIKTIIGGGSKLTLLVDLLDASTLPATVVVRMDMSNSIVGSTVADEFHLLELVHSAGLPVPKPYRLETGKEILGAPFIVVGKVEGRNIGDWFEITEPSRAFAVGLAHALAKLHRIPPEKCPHLPGASMSVRERVAQEIAYYEQIWRGTGETSIAMEQGIAWLKAHLDLADGQRAIIHRDVGCHNMLGHDGELAALLDWETAAIGHPAFDLMYAHVAVVQMMPWEEFLAEYARAGGGVPGTAEQDFYRLLTAIYGMHFCYLSRTFIETEFSETMVVAYAAQRIYLHYERAVHDAVRIALDRDDNPS